MSRDRATPATMQHAGNRDSQACDGRRHQRVITDAATEYHPNGGATTNSTTVVASTAAFHLSTPWR